MTQKNVPYNWSKSSILHAVSFTYSLHEFNETKTTLKTAIHHCSTASLAMFNIVHILTNTDSQT